MARSAEKAEAAASRGAGAGVRWARAARDNPARRQNQKPNRRTIFMRDRPFTRIPNQG